MGLVISPSILDRLLTNASRLTRDAAHDAWLAGLQIAAVTYEDVNPYKWVRGVTPNHHQNHVADLAGLTPAKAVAVYDALNAEERRELLRVVRWDVAGPKKAPKERGKLTWDEVRRGLEFRPARRAVVGENLAAYYQFLTNRPFAEAAAKRLAALRQYVDDAPYCWPPEARAIAVEQAEEAEDEQMQRDLREVAHTSTLLQQKEWAERHIRIAASIYADYSRELAKEVHDEARIHANSVARRLRYCSPYLDHVMPAVPAIPQRSKDEDDYRHVGGTTGPWRDVTIACNMAPERHCLPAALTGEAHYPTLADPTAEQAVTKAFKAACAAHRLADDIERRYRATCQLAHIARIGNQRVQAARLAKQVARLEWDNARVDALLADEDLRREQVALYGEKEVIDACHEVSVRGRMRRAIDETAAHATMVLGLTGGPKWMHLPAQVTDTELKRGKERAALNRARLEETVYVLRDDSGAVILDDNGEPIVVNAAEAADVRVKARNARNYALCLGAQGDAERRGWTLVFLTLTLPGRWHANPSEGRNTYDPSLGPIEARQELQDRLHRALAMVSDRGIRYYGPRAREGQEDGTPHDHLPLFVAPEHVESLLECFERHFPEPLEVEARETEEAGDEVRAQQLRDRLDGISRDKRVGCNSRVWTAKDQHDDPDAKAAVASYIYGYAMKTTTDALDDDDGAARGACWAHERRIRRWAWVGLRRGLLTDWDAIYRQKQRPQDPYIRSVWDAMQAKDWAGVFRLLDATGEADQPPLARDYEEVVDRHGKVVRRAIAVANAARPVADWTEHNVVWLRRQGEQFVAARKAEWQEEWDDLQTTLALSESYSRAGAIAPSLSADGWVEVGILADEYAEEAWMASQDPPDDEFCDEIDEAMWW
ncbi:MAG: replication endonuclease [Rhodospirillaceae bacterium]|nr:replication endonuclease [Rhodospirillales bacterium]